MTLSHLVEAECVGEAENPEEVEPLLERPLETPLVIIILSHQRDFQQDSRGNAA